MRRIYEGCFILDVTGKEAGAKDIIDFIDKQIHALGGKSISIQRMDKKPFARVTGRIDSGYYANFVFELESDKVQAFKEKFKHNDEVYRILITDAPPEATQPRPATPTDQAAA
ncbi:MAG: 30S ribosomal protein S6 [Verrucomicrobiae bacterium]|nr:30S ribosomal protein S6 [Verrucomicrobiae bacterium]